MPRLTATPDAGETREMDSPLESEEGTNPANTLTPDFWPLEMRQKKFLLVEAPQLLVLCYGGPRKRMYI